MIEALRLEVNEQKKIQSGQRFKLKNGKFLQQIANGFIYEFYSQKKIIAMEDSPAILEIEGYSEKCEIISISSKSIQLIFQKKLSRNLLNSLLVIENWYLLDILKKRLKEDSKPTVYSKSMDLFNFNKKRIELKTNKYTKTNLELNESQINANESTFKSNINIVWGPPGTGKTQTIASIITKAITNNLKVLLLSLSNNAVDQAMLKTIKAVEEDFIKEGKIIRVGTPKKSMLDNYNKLGSPIFVRQIAEEKLPNIFKEKTELEVELKVVGNEHRNVSNTIQYHRQIDNLKDKITSLTQDINGFYSKKKEDRNKNKILKIQSNLDEIIKLYKSLDQYNNKDLDYLYDLAFKLGRKSEKIENRLQKIYSVIDAEIIQIICSASLVSTTLTKAYIDNTIKNLKFDIVIIDEVSMVPLPMVYWATSRTKSNITLVGDFLQLPPICLSKDEFVNKWYKRNIFAFLGIENVSTALKKTNLLDTQYRMHPDIAGIINNYMYCNSLKNCPEVSKNYHYDDVSLNRAVTFINTSHSHFFCSSVEPKGRFNLSNADLCYNLLKKISKHNEGKSFGIVTPYKHQAKLIDKFISEDQNLQEIDVAINTIHSFQGGEKDVIIFDTVEGKGPRKWSMLNEENYTESNLLLNVAISRARNKLYIIGDRNYLQSNLEENMLLSKVIKNLKNDATIGSSLVMPIFPKPNPSVQDVKRKKIEYLNAVKKAKKNVIIFTQNFIERMISFHDYDKDQIIQYNDLINHLKRKNVKITLITNEYYHKERQKFIESVVSHFRKGIEIKLRDRQSSEILTIVDNTYIWYGSFDLLKLEDYGTIRLINSPIIVNTISEYFDLESLLDPENINGKVCPKCRSDLIINDIGYKTKEKYFRCQNSNCKSSWNRFTKWSDIKKD